MARHEFAIVDPLRSQQFHIIGATRRLFASPDQFVAADGNAWLFARRGPHCFGFTVLGEGWLFDPYAASRRGDAITERRRLNDVGTNQYIVELSRIVGLLRLGPKCERLLWVLHLAAIAARRSVFRLSDVQCARSIWGPSADNWPGHWRSSVISILRGISWLHLTTVRGNDRPQFGRMTALLTHVGGLQSRNSRCDDECADRDGPRHSHFLINLGRGFLGSLEEFAVADDETGIREYSFPISMPQNSAPSLKRLGKAGQLVSVYVPAKLGDPEACKRLTTRQRGLLQAIVRETTRPVKRRRARSSHKEDCLRGEVIRGGRVPDLSGKHSTICGLLAIDKQYVSFGGNGVRRGLGYRITTPGGWLAKAGYRTDEVHHFVRDLDGLVEFLGLSVVGIHVPSRQWVSWDDVKTLAQQKSRRRRLDNLQLRIYTEVGYTERWNVYFGWTSQAAIRPAEANPVLGILSEMRRKRISQRMLALGLDIDPSFLSKLFSGKKSWPAGSIERVRQFIATRLEPNFSLLAGTARSSAVTMLETALSYRQRHWSVVPQASGAKMPLVKWKSFQERLPTEEEIQAWFQQWPDAGLAVALGPISNLFVVDVDGPEGHAALVERLGAEPPAPKALSGSRKPYRYHLYFADPGLPTRAKATPWHPKLEFRGKGGIVVIPPSLHSSGNSYCWENGRSLDDLTLPEVPHAVRAALAEPSRQARNVSPSPILPNLEDVDASPSTLEFLQGHFADGPHWNDRLFRAACDLSARNLPLDRAESLLLAGARPWDDSQAETARQSIRSAYSQPRAPSTR